MRIKKALFFLILALLILSYLVYTEVYKKKDLRVLAKILMK